MATSDPYADLRDRDYFHIMLNLDSFDGFLPTARALAERFLGAARKRQDDPHLEPELRHFTYSKAAFEARLDQIYQGLVDDVTRYEAQRGWTRRTRDDVIEWMLQMAPFNQTDGAWLRYIAPVGPIDEISALLFTIWVEELGGGDPKLHHANLYTELLRSVGIELADIRSREYADNPDLLDSAFTVPLFQLVVSQFPQDYFPELLGMTQYLEWSSVELRSQVLLNQHFGLDTHFYEMHVAIDNAAAGHGAMARRAIELYLERVRVDGGDEVMEDVWERIWNGYVAFATTGTLGADMHRRPDPLTPAERVAAMVRQRGPKARLNHGQKRLAGKLINDLFADPEELMSALVEGGMIVPGAPAGSAFFALTRADGPMFKIFTEAELETWREWVRALAAGSVGAVAGSAGVAAAGIAADGIAADGVAAGGQATGEATAAPREPAAARMVRLIDTMRGRQDGVAAHQAEKLTGPDPADPSRTVTQPVAWWFTQPAVAFMTALANEDNGWVRPGKPDDSPFVTDLLRGRNAMGRALSGSAAGTGGLSWADVAVEWINEGCPLPDAEPARPLTLLSPPERVAAHPTGAIHGTGSVH